MANCEVCGASPAARIKLKRGVGLLLVQHIYKANALLCRSCAKKATSDFQRETFKKGWTSPRSALMNPFYMAGNAINQVKHERKLEGSDNTMTTEYSSLGDSVAHSKPQLSSSGANPVDILAAFAPTDATQRRFFSSLLVDFTGSGVVGSQQSIDAATHQPTREQAEQLLVIATSVVEAAQVSGGLGSGLPHAIFISAMEDWTGVSLTEFSPVQRAISSAVSDASVELCLSKRFDEALGASMIGCVLFINSIAWQKLQG